MSDIDRNYFIENYATITSTEMIDFIEKNYPEDRKLIAEECLKDYDDKEKGLNYLTLKSVFYHRYFPEKFVERKRKMEVIYDWLNL